MADGITFSAKQITRFWSLVERSRDGCWTWNGARLAGGYGVIFIDGKNHKAHRIAWILANGEIPSGLFVCHHCDNPSCVRSDHLFLGTPRDNHDDMKAKGRAPRGDTSGRRKHPDNWLYVRGEGHPNAKLTNDLVREIRRRFIRRGPYRTNAQELAQSMSLPAHTIISVGDRKVWRHIE